MAIPVRYLWTSIALMAACQKPAPQAAFDYASRVGVAVQKSNRACLEIANARLQAGQRIPFVNSTQPQNVGEIEITGAASEACPSADHKVDGMAGYQFKVVKGEMEPAAPAFAFPGFNGSFSKSATGVSSDLDGDGNDESFRSCLSTEGVHLTIWTGRPLEGQRRWHYYYYLGYDVEPNCTEAEIKE